MLQHTIPLDRVLSQFEHNLFAHTIQLNPQLNMHDHPDFQRNVLCVLINLVHTTIASIFSFAFCLKYPDTALSEEFSLIKADGLYCLNQS